MPTPPDDLRRRFARLASHNILANVTVPLAGLVDLAMLGHLPDLRFLAGVALGGVVFDYVYWTFGFLRMSTTGTTAQALGRGDDDEAMRTLLRGLVLAAGLGAALVLIRGPLGELAFSVLRGADGVESAGLDYYRARILGAPATLAGLVFLGWFLGREDSRTALVLTVTANLANIVLNYVFIMRFGMAARGAGLATMASQYLMVGLAIAIFLRRFGRPQWRGAIDSAGFFALLRLNGDILLRTLCLTSAFAVFTNLSAILGTAVLAANALLLRVVSTAAYLIDGAAYATESLAGRFHGSRDPRLARLLRDAMVVGLAFAALVALTFLAAPRPLLGVLTSHSAVIEDAVAVRWWLLPTLLLSAPAYILDGFFLGLTAGRILRNTMLVAALVVFLPIAVAAHLNASSSGLWAALVAFMAARTILLGHAARREMAHG